LMRLTLPNRIRMSAILGWNVEQDCFTKATASAFGGKVALPVALVMLVWVASVDSSILTRFCAGALTDDASLILMCVCRCACSVCVRCVQCCDVVWSNNQQSTNR